jgi:hypothetical protein
MLHSVPIISQVFAVGKFNTRDNGYLEMATNTAVTIPASSGNVNPTTVIIKSWCALNCGKITHGQASLIMAVISA